MLLKPHKTATIRILEAFNSIQGEGRYAGTPMFFIRLPYCNRNQDNMCRTWDGRAFTCDTDLSGVKEVPIDYILDQCEIPRVCITGGEPFDVRNQEALELILRSVPAGFDVHFETNGTIWIPPWCSGYYIACSPKWGFRKENIKYINEFRFLIDERFEPESVPELITNLNNVYLSPIACGAEPSKTNLKLCLDLLKDFPYWKLSLQMHKYWGIR